MSYVQKIPFILSSVAGLVTYGLCRKTGVTVQETYVKMAVSLIVFFAVGLYIRFSLGKIMDEVELKKQRDEEEKWRLEKEANAIAAAEESNAAKGTSVDYRVEDDEFSPLTISDYIRSKE